MRVRAVLGLVLALALVVLAPNPVAACLCGSPEEGRANSSVAFTGVVAAVEDPYFLDWNRTTGDPILYTFAVEEVIKGTVDMFPVVRSTRDEGSGSCAIDMAIGERWQIDAHRNGGDLWTSSCSGSSLLATGVTPPPVPRQAPPAGLGAAVAVIFGIGVVSLLIVGRRRRRTTSVA